MAIYTPQGYAPFTCHAVLHRNVIQFPGGFDAQVTEPHSEISLLAEEIAASHPHGESQRGDTIAVGGQDWTVESVTADDGYVIRVVVK